MASFGIETEGSYSHEQKINIPKIWLEKEQKKGFYQISTGLDTIVLYRISQRIAIIIILKKIIRILVLYA